VRGYVLSGKTMINPNHRCQKSRGRPSC
jgi:hypothetical protein